MSKGWILVLGCCALAGCSVEILHDIDESAANEVLAALDRHGIGGEKRRETVGSKSVYAVAVPRAYATAAWKVLRDERLPRPARQGLGEVFGKATLVPTATQERALMHHALAEEVSRTLESVGGVLEARVHLVLPSRDPLAPPDSAVPGSKGSVLLRVTERSPLTEDQVQRVVAGSVKGLDPKSVSVVLVSDEGRRSATQASAAASLSSVGPFRVAAGSRAALLATLSGALVLLALMGTVTLLFLRHNRALVAQLAQRPGGPGPGPSLSRLEGSLSLIGRSLSPRSHSRPPED